MILLIVPQGLEGLIREEWGYSSPITLILVTDGGIGFGPYSLHNLVTGKLDIGCCFYSAYLNFFGFSVNKVPWPI